MLLIFSIVLGIYRYNEFIDLTGNIPDIKLDLSWSNLRWSYLFRPTLFLLLPFVGIFLKKSRFSWIIFTQYFYFLILSFLVQINVIDNFDLNTALITILVFVVMVSQVLIMNIKKVHYEIYGIRKRKLLSCNIYAFILGILEVLLLLVFE